MPRSNARWTDLDHCKQDDDILSYLFIDLGLFRSKHDKLNRISRKFQRDDFQPNPTVVWQQYLDILKTFRNGDLELKEASTKLLRTGTFRTLLQKKRELTQANHLVYHVDRYLELWRPDSPFVLFETKRYDLTKKEMVALAQSEQEASPALNDASLPASDPATPDNTLALEGPQASTSAIASPVSRHTAPRKAAKAWGAPLNLGVKVNKDFSVHEHLRLYGSAADITDEEDDELRMDQEQLKADFSVLYNVQKQCFQLFMGPGRFVNHDCNPNVALIRSGKGSLCFKVIRPLKAGDEILTSYGTEYFGPGNESCRCLTCKQNRRGAYQTKTNLSRKKVAAADPAARTTRSGNLMASQSLRKKVHQANIVRTTVTITQGARQSARSSTQSASEASLKTAKRAIRQASSSNRKRRRGDSDSDSDSPPPKRKVKRRKATKTISGDSSDLTDVDDLDMHIERSESSLLLPEEGLASRAMFPELLEAAVTQQNDTSAHEGKRLAAAHPTFSDLHAASIPVQDGDVPSPATTGTPRAFDMLSPALSDPDGSAIVTHSPAAAAGKFLQNGVMKLVHGAFRQSLSSATGSSDTGSGSQASIFEEEEQV